MDIVNAQDFEQQNQSAVDDQLLVRFFIKPFEDKAETAKQGRPIFIDREYIEIRTPGSRDAVCRPASSRDIGRFPRHYDAFKARTSQEFDEGTPLTEWPLISRSMVEELSFFNVKTVEQLVAMSDQNSTQFMGINTLKAKAKDWLATAKEHAAAEALQAELKKRDDEIAELKAAVAQLTAKKPRKKATRKKAAAKKE